MFFSIHQVCTSIEWTCLYPSGEMYMWNCFSGWGETVKLVAEFLRNVSAKFQDFLKEFWNSEHCNVNFIKTADILRNSGKNPWKSRRKITDLRTYQQNFAKNDLKISKISPKCCAKFWNFWDWSGAKVCKSCSSRKMLKNEALVAKIGVDTAENDPSKVSGGEWVSPWVSYTDPTGFHPLKCAGSVNSPSPPPQFRETLKGSFSAVSTPIFATKCSFQHF